MTRTDWFRNTDWNNSIEAAFTHKLARAKNKAQYLRIQACALVEKHPLAALKLLDLYFDLGENFDRAQAHVDRANAWLSLGKIERAVESYEAALAWEKLHPNTLTQAYVKLPFVVAVHGIKARYEQSLLILEQNESRLTFPVEHFLWNTACSLIHIDLGDIVVAKEYAHVALEAAAREASGFHYHPTIGLVNGGYEKIHQRLGQIVTHL